MSRWEVWLRCPDCGREVQILGMEGAQDLSKILYDGCDHVPAPVEFDLIDAAGVLTSAVAATRSCVCGKPSEDGVHSEVFCKWFT